MPLDATFLPLRPLVQPRKDMFARLGRSSIKICATVYTKAQSGNESGRSAALMVPACRRARQQPQAAYAENLKIWDSPATQNPTGSRQLPRRPHSDEQCTK